MPGDRLIATKSVAALLKRGPDDPSWTEFYQRYKSVIVYRALQAGLQVADAEEIVQAVMISVAQRICTFDDRAGSGFHSWVQRIITSKIVDFLRKLKRRETEPWDDRDFPNELDLASAERNGYLAEVAAEAVRRLRRRASEKAFRSFNLSVLEGRGPTATAKLLKVTVRSVQNADYQMKRALRSEFRALERHGGGRAP